MLADPAARVPLRNLSSEATALCEGKENGDSRVWNGKQHVNICARGAYQENKY